jgi:hypothetical protein
VEHGLVEGRQVVGPHHAAPAGHPHAPDGGVVEAEQGLGRHFGDGQLPHAEGGLELVGGGGLTGGDQLGEGIAAGFEAEHSWEAGRVGHAGLYDVAEVLTGDPLQELDQHPVSRGRVVLEARAGLPVQPPAFERGTASRTRVTRRDDHRRAREARRVEHHLLDGDDVLPVGAELGHQLNDPTRDVDQPVTDHGPHRSGHEGLGRRVDDVAGVGRGVADRLGHDDLAVEAEGQLAGRQQTLVDLAVGAGQQGVDSGSVDRAHGDSCCDIGRIRESGWGVRR